MNRLLERLRARLADTIPPGTETPCASPSRACTTEAAPSPGITEEEALAVARLPASDILDILAVAQSVRSARKGPSATTCGIVNAKSGRCGEDCAFCAQSSRHATGAPVHGLLGPDALLRHAEELARAGVRRFGIVTSGNALSEREFDAVCHAARLLRERVDIGLCASLGQLATGSTGPKGPEEQGERARRLKDAGISSYHHNLETARSFFPHICTTHPYDDDIATVREAARAGLRTCCGGILGLGETWEHRVELALTLRELDVDSIPLNFLHPIPGTRLGHRSPLPPMEALRAIAVFRLLHPHRDILVCGGRETTLGQWQSWVFAAGANGLMVGNYLTTAGRALADDMDMLAALGVDGIAPAGESAGDRTGEARA